MNKYKQYERKKSNENKKFYLNNHSSVLAARHFMEDSFQCKHCRALVTTSSITSGVQNRNHCPYCLWSRHMDLHEPGDRLCACKAPMQPLGLTVKKSKKKYTSRNSGELMIIHRCVECSHTSINRIAADDDSQALLDIFRHSLETCATLSDQLSQAGIHLLDDESVLLIQLYGRAG